MVLLWKLFSSEHKMFQNKVRSHFLKVAFMSIKLSQCKILGETVKRDTVPKVRNKVTGLKKKL